MAREEAEGGTTSRGSDRTRARILEAAMDAFARHGFDGTSVRSIAARCGLSDAAVFYYFPTKRHLLDALWDEAPTGDFPSPIPGRPLSADVIRELVVATMRISARNFTYLRLVAREVLRSDETAIAIRNSSRARWRKVLGGHLEPAGPRAPALVELFTAAVTGYLLRLEIEHGDEYPKLVLNPDVQERVVQAVLRLIPIDAGAAAA